MLTVTVNTLMLNTLLFVSDELSIQDPESNMKLAQRIEKDVVSASVTA